MADNKHLFLADWFVFSRSAVLSRAWLGVEGRLLHISQSPLTGRHPRHGLQGERQEPKTGKWKHTGLLRSQLGAGVL